jgi:ParB family transcriptional regulator, chromosome partitioning protein
MDKLVIEYRSIADLVAYDNNPRNNLNAIEKVAASINEFGFKNPVIIDKDNVIIAGHTRVLAAESLGYDEVPTLQVTDLTEEQIKAFRIADNKVAEYSEWDENLLAAELNELRLTDMDLELTGFELHELDDLLFERSFDDEHEEHREPINDEGIETPKSFEYTMTIGKRKLILTEEEHDLLIAKLDEYVDENGVTFGFARFLLEGE